MSQKRDLTGKRFGRLTVMEETGKRESGYCVWRCRCDCGNEIQVSSRQLYRGTVTNCGCIPKTTARKGAVAEDLTGRIYGQLTVMYRVENKNGRTQWRCRCTCGREKTVTAHDLKAGRVLSCGCLKREVQLNIQKKLHMVDGTCLEWLEKRKHRKDNTSGCRGVYQMKNGKYRADIGFKSRRFYLGTFKTYEDAVQARMKAENKVHQGFVEAYYNWKENADKDPAWAKEHPFVFEVEKRDGEIIVTTGHEGTESENTYTPD